MAKTLRLVSFIQHGMDIVQLLFSDLVSEFADEAAEHKQCDVITETPCLPDGNYIGCNAYFTFDG